MYRRRQILALTRVRVLLFLREPEVVFWVFGFPLVLALVLGWAFQDRGPSAEKVGVLVEVRPQSIMILIIIMFCIVA